jgi:predicted nuclease with TOPRIM domain
MVQNDLRHKVNDFADENNKLSATVTKFEEQLVPLKETEAKLERIAEKNGSTVEKMKQLLRTNRTTLQQMRENLEADVLNSMMDVVLKADRSEDGSLSASEISALTLRLKMLPTIEMNEGTSKRIMHTQNPTRCSAVYLLPCVRQGTHN